MKSYISHRQVKDQAEVEEAAKEYCNNFTVKKLSQKYIKFFS